MEITFVTGNKNKFKEAQDILQQTGIEIIQNDVDLFELQGSLEEIVRKKTIEAYKHVKASCIVDDSSLTFKALNGLPGPYIKHFLNKMDLEQIYKMIDNFQIKEASAITSIGYTQNGIDTEVFSGIVKGVIVKPQGNNNFGFDPIFQPNGSSKTYAQMNLKEKEKISHRTKALFKLKDFLINKINL